jgi:hypothetical protein
MATHQRIVLALLIMTFPLTSSPAAEDAVFRLEKNSIADEDASSMSTYMRYGVVTAQGASCQGRPLPNVKYPKLKSKTPLYGYMTFGASPYGMTITRTYARGAGSGFHFVLDESQPEEAATAKKPSLLNELAQALTNTRPSLNVKANYDTLYFDSNGDSDLTNDAPLSLNKQPPKSLPFSGSGVRFFEPLQVKSKGDEGTSAEFLPWLNVRSTQSAYLFFVSTAVHRGEIRIGDKTFEALVGSASPGSSPKALLRPKSGVETSRTGGWRTVPLNTLHQTDGEFYTISLGPNAGTLTVSPYRGKYGMFEIASRDPEIEKLGVVGTLRSKGQMRIPLGDPDNQYTSEHPRQCRLPEGKYQPYYITVDYGTVQVRLSYCYYDTSGQRLSQQPCEINIREDRPFILDFSTKPAVVFTTPAKGHVAKPGDKVVVKALIMDAELGSLVRGIYDTTQQTGSRTVRNAEGESVSVPRYASLTPTVTITDSAGKEVAAGPMPFG